MKMQFSHVYEFGEIIHIKDYCSLFKSMIMVNVHTNESKLNGSIQLLWSQLTGSIQRL